LNSRSPTAAVLARAAVGSNAKASKLKISEKRFMLRFLLTLHRDEKPSSFQASRTKIDVWHSNACEISTIIKNTMTGGLRSMNGKNLIDYEFFKTARYFGLQYRAPYILDIRISQQLIQLSQINYF
jgi:hypothetical protein